MLLERGPEAVELAEAAGKGDVVECIVRCDESARDSFEACTEYRLADGFALYFSEAKIRKPARYL